jgi:hypothetical protein
LRQVSRSGWKIPLTGKPQVPPAQQKAIVKPAGANTQVEIYLSAMAHSLFTTNNLFQSLQGTLAHLSQDHQAYSCEIQKKQEMIEDLEEKVKKMTQDINHLHRVNASLQRSLGEASAVNKELHENAVELKLVGSKIPVTRVNPLTRTRGQFTRTLGNTIAQLMEERKGVIVDSQDASDAATCPEQTAERGPQLPDWETPVDPMVVQDSRAATVVQGGGMVIGNSLGSESSGIKSYEICPDEAQIARDLTQNSGRPRLRRKRQRERLTLEIPDKAS